MIVVVIPARFGSSRFPGKPLAPLAGCTGRRRTLIERTWRVARQVRGADRVVVATDDDRIVDAVRDFGGDAVLVGKHAVNGTERCAALLEDLPDDPDLIVNLQGDSLLTPPSFLESLIDRMHRDPDCGVATPVVRCDPALQERLRVDARAGRVGGTTVAVASDGRALYFSKSLIPYIPDQMPSADAPLYFHVGVYAYRPAALRAYCGLPVGVLERCEGLEQLRFLENGIDIHTVQVDAPDSHLWELNNPEDVAPIEAALLHRGIE